jgi:hypothetical protein
MTCGENSKGAFYHPTTEQISKTENSPTINSISAILVLISK